MRGIPFKQWEVQAHNEGRKSSFVRVVKSKYHLNKIDNYNGGYQGRYTMVNLFDGISKEFTKMIYSPYKVGDILYIKEAWNENPAHYLTKDFEELPPKEQFGIYKVDSPSFTGGWHPSIHMPEEAARSFIRITGVKVMRVQDINGQDNHDALLKEGILSYTKDEKVFKYAMSLEQFSWRDMPRTPWKAYALNWDMNHKKDLNRYGWDANPWVWVYEYERVNKEDING